MKKITILSGILLSSLAFSQVGINTPNPLGSLHVDGAKDNPNTGTPSAAQQANDVVVTKTGYLGVGTISPGTALDVNGAITARETAVRVGLGNSASIPNNVGQARLFGAAGGTVVITGPASPNTGQHLVIYNNTTGGFGANLSGFMIPNGQAVEFIYSNGDWIATSSSGIVSEDTNIYNSNGTLTGNRTVTQGANSLVFNATGANAFSVANGSNNILSVNASNSRVGIGTASPTNVLDVRSATNGAVKIADGTQGANKVLTSDASGVATWRDLPATADTNIYNSNGTLTGNRTVTQGANSLAFNATGANAFSVNNGSTNIFSVNAANSRVGIGTTSPQNLLDLGPGNGKKLAVWNSTVGDDFYGLGNAPSVLQFFAGAAATGDPLMTLNKNGRVGIGTTAPTNVLDVRSATNGAVKIADGTQGVNKVLTSDANGVATWKDLPASTSTNIYNSNGTLTGNRLVTQGANSLAFNATGANAFSITNGSTNVFSVNASNSRVGIGTTSPQNLLDLGPSSGKKLAVWNSAAGDDFYGLGNAPSVLQFFAGATAAADPLMTLNRNGRVGIGTTAPTNVLDVRSATNGAVKIVDGTQGAGRILTSDANGVATWQRAATNVAVGTLGAGYALPFSQFSDFRYTGSSITLPPGRWMVTVSLLIAPSGTLTVNDWIFVRSTFSETNLTTIGQTGTQSPDVIRPTLMSFQLAGPYNGGQKYNVATGSIQINNTSGATKTYRYVVGNTQASGTVSGAQINAVGGSWSENAIYAVAVN